ncbi:hypothetical protein L596_029712 [Steinernema carpocapsae]|uniref:VWFA domain-containing protein n=1 Tax=Steinernema carpocapsae TaxID=34508 RepID=A0A4U5LQL1_STECR|nr:hypothetical protein L596_029712 [Steinernema carpocapsae]
MNDVLAKASGVNMGWFNKYVGVVFYDSTLSQIIMSKDAGTFIKNMAAELQANTKPSTSSKRPIFSALEKVFRPAYITTRSQAFLITGGLPNDLPKFEATLDALSRKHIYVNTIIMGDTNLPGQAPYTDPSFEKLSELTYISGGGVYQMPSYDMLDTFLVTDVGTLFDNYYISSKLVKNCSSATEYIQVNSHSTLLTFDLFAKQAAVTIHDPLGAPHLAVKSAHTKTNALYLIQNKGNDNKTLVPGLWTVTVNNNVENPGACLINVEVRLRRLLSGPHDRQWTPLRRHFPGS